jgi:hypothetical protein
VAQIRASGAQLVSVSENIDETPSGLLLHCIMSSIAVFYSRKTSPARSWRARSRTAKRRPEGRRLVQIPDSGRSAPADGSSFGEMVEETGFNPRPPPAQPGGLTRSRARRARSRASARACAGA